MLSESLNERQKQFAEDIRTSAMSLLDIINEVLDLSKIHSGKMNLVPIHYNFNTMMNNISSMVHSLIKGKNIAFSTDIKGNLPEYLYGDDVRLRQILLNLLSNAVKFTDAGYVRLLLDVTDKNLNFTVKDTGRGIREKDIPNIFEAFKQLESAKNRDLQGTGLGLSITKGLVEMMNGDIKAESIHGEGTTIHVAIPYIPGDGAKVLHADSNDRVICPADTKILVVDDNKINLNVISGLLQLYNITPFSASSGPEAIEMARRDRYDLVFMDHMMPEMDGVEAANIIRDFGIKVPIIALTANAVSSAKEMLLATGMDDFLAKPIIKKELDKMLVKWIPFSQLVSEQTVKNSGYIFKSEEQNEFWKKIRSIEEISVDTGLERVSGQKNLYENTLKLLVRGIEKTNNNLNAFLAAKDMHSFAIEAHSVKTSLANLGAMELSAIAHELEISSGQGDYSFCASALKPFSNALNNLGNKLKEAFSVYPIKKDSAIPSELALILTRMKDAFLRMDFVEINEEVRNLEAFEPGDGLGQEIEDIKDAVMVMDYDGASELIQNLLQHL